MTIPFKQKNYISLFLILLLLCASLDGGAAVIDSLKKSLLLENEENQVKIMCDLCWEYRFVDSDSAIYYGDKAYNLAQQLNDQIGIAQSLNDLGIIYIDHGRYDDAINNFNNALEIRLTLNDSSGLASLYNKIGIVLQKQGKLKEALDFQLNALEIYEGLNHELWIAYSMNNIAIINFNIGNLQTSLEYHKKGLELRKRLNDDYGVAGSYGNIANVLFALGDTNAAISNYKDALEICRKIENKEAESVQLTNLGAMYIAKSQYNKALKYLEASLVIRNELDDKKAISSTMIKIGECYMNMEDYDKAYIYLNKANKVANQIDVNEELVQSYLDLTRLFNKMNEADSAFKYLNLYAIVKDSVYKIRLEQQIIDAQTKYDVERKNKDLELFKSKTELNETQLRQRKTEIWLLVIVIVSVIGSAIFTIYRRKLKQKEAIDAARIYHNEKMIGAVIAGQEEERRKIARELHDGVGQNLAGVKINWINAIESPDQDTVSSDIILMLDKVISELRSISHQMMPKELEQFGLVPAFNGFLELMLSKTQIFYKFEQLNINGRFDPKVELGVFRVLQELTGNIIKHSGAKTMTVQLINRKNNLILLVIDDGKGFDTKKHIGNGIGLINIESRVEALKGKMNFESFIGKGTEVTIRIPINE